MFYTAEIGIFDLFAPDDRDPMTFICELELYFLQIYQMCQIWTSYVKAFEIYYLTDR